MMIPELDGRKLTGDEKVRVAQVLRAAPWCWPNRHLNPYEFQTALQLAPKGPPAMLCGQAPVLTVRKKTAFLSLVQFGQDRLDGLQTVNLGPEANKTWSRTRAAVYRSLPVLWETLPEGLTPQWHRLAQWSDQRGILDDESTLGIVDGGSLGLPFFLAMVSRLFDSPLPDNMAATGDLDEHGGISEVAGITMKLGLVAERAPHISQVLVPEANRAEAEEVAAEIRATLQGRDFQVLPVGCGAAALALAFKEESLVQSLLRCGMKEDRRAQVVESLFGLALKGNPSVVEWRPLRRAAETALEKWKSLNSVDVWRLDFVSGVAARHERNEGGFAIPNQDELMRLIKPHRVMVVAHVVAQCADSGSPPVKEVERLAAEHLVRGLEASQEHYRLLGSLGRLYAVTGRPEEGLACQLEALEGWLALSTFDEASHPLSAGLRLAGALGDRNAFEKLRKAAEKRSNACGVDGGTPYVELDRARAMLDLDYDIPEALRILTILASGCLGSSNEWVRAHVRFAGARHKVRALWMLDRREEALKELDCNSWGTPTELDEGSAAPNRHLAQLWIALERGDASTAAREVEELHRLEPGVIGHLSAAATAAGQPVPEYINRFYPY